MHATFFRLKRAHHSSLRIARQILRATPPLTPARFDLLYVLHQSPHGFVDQKDLTRCLGLHHSTVSKMLKRLDELGLTVRGFSQDDWRQREVCLTALGRELIRETIAGIVESGIAAIAVRSGVAPLRWWNAPHCRRQICRTNGTLRRYALAFSDTAVPLYAPSARAA